MTIEASNPQTYLNRAVDLQKSGRLDEALTNYDQALALDPRNAQAWKNRGTLLLRLSRLEESVESFDRAIALRPDFPDAFNNRGSALHHQKRLTEALTSFDQAIALRPEFTNAIINRGMAKLLNGNFGEGWHEYAWRWMLDGIPKMSLTDDARVWRGEELKGRSIAVYTWKQGFGDIIQFARYLPLLVQRGAKVTLYTRKRLLRLLQPLLSGIDGVTSLDGKGPFEFFCPLMGLPLGFETHLSSIPSEVPYLEAERDQVLRWKNFLGNDGVKIGIGWQAEPSQDGGRSIPLAEFIPLSRLTGVRLISLQKNHGLDQLAALPAGTVEVLDNTFDSGPDAFIDTAAIMANLDLIITADISIAHLAGALGRPVWVVLKHVPDWRWLLDRDDCPWYPTMRLLRQRESHGWSSVFVQVERELRSLL